MSHDRTNIADYVGALTLDGPRQIRYDIVEAKITADHIDLIEQRDDCEWGYRFHLNGDLDQGPLTSNPQLVEIEVGWCAPVGTREATADEVRLLDELRTFAAEAFDAQPPSLYTSVCWVDRGGEATDDVNAAAWVKHVRTDGGPDEFLVMRQPSHELAPYEADLSGKPTPHPDDAVYLWPVYGDMSEVGI